jgi:hypothetical protein
MYDFANDFRIRSFSTFRRGLWGGLCFGRIERGKVAPSGFRYEMAVAGRHEGGGVPEPLLNVAEGRPCHGVDGCERVAQVVEPDGP